MIADVLDLRDARAWAASGAARAIRHSANLSLGEVATAIQVDKTPVLRWERGDFQPSGDAAVRYARLLRALMEPTDRKAAGRKEVNPSPPPP